MFPFDPTAVRNSPFVRDLSAEERRRVEAREARNAGRMSINMKMITSVDVIVELTSAIRVGSRFNQLCDLERYMRMTYKQIVHEVVTMNYNDAIMLCTIPPLFRPSDAPIFFD